MKATIKLRNGDKVRLGDLVSFINSDGEVCTDFVRMRPNRSLYFWNISVHPTVYTNAFKV